MFKQSSDDLHYLARTGSHSTKESRTGRIKMIPEWAQEPEEYYCSLKEQHESLLGQLKEATEKMGQVKAQLIQSHQYGTRAQTEKLGVLVKQYGEKIQVLQNEIARFRELVRNAAKDSFALVFWEVCRRSLDQDKYNQLLNQAKELLGREVTPFPAGPQEKGGRTEAEKLKDKRQKARHSARYSAGGYKRENELVWSDEQGIKTEYGALGRKVSHEFSRNIGSRVTKK